MAFWRKNRDEFEAMDQYIEENPGSKAADIAAEFDVARSTITRRLPSMEEAGYLYYEDDDGGLWPMKKRK